MVAPAYGNPAPNLQTIANFKPVDDRIIAKRLPAGETSTGIALPDENDLGIDRFLVLAVGPGRVCEADPTKGRLPMSCEPGDVVRIYGGDVLSFRIDREEYVSFQSWQVVTTAPLEKVDAKQLAEIIAGGPAKPKLLKV